jgi:hypothetical protein
MIKCASAAIAAGLIVSAASADLTGDSVMGELVFGSLTTNFWTPDTAVVDNVDAGGPEFQYIDGFSAVNMDVDGSQVIIEQSLTSGPGSANSWEIVLSDLDPGLVSINVVQNDFGAAVSLVGSDRIEVSQGLFTLDATKRLVIDLTFVPAPGAVAAFAGVGVFAARRRR